jgi:hypothetical protein
MRRWVCTAAATGLFAVAAVLCIPSAAVAAKSSLERDLLAAVQAVGFDQVIDFGPVENLCPSATWCRRPTPTVMHTPNVDVAVIELKANGRARQAANVLLSRDYPTGVVVPLDRDLAARSVRFQRWDITRWNGGTFDDDGTQTSTTGWTNDPPLTAADDIVAGREDAPLRFMSPYPASLFKLLVAFHTLRLVDRGTLDLHAPYTHDPVGGCGGGLPVTRSNGDWLDLMITSSNNRAACALLKQMHVLGEVDAMNVELRALGLGTLQVNGTSPLTGGIWQPGEIHMTAMDSARLLWLIEGAPGVLWKGPGHNPVKASALTGSSRALLRRLLSEQGFNVALSTSNFCGLAYPSAGIPQRIDERWIDPDDGTVNVAGIPYGRNVSSCNAAAEVSFAHKTGLTYNYGSDAGIVRSLPGKPARRYVIALLSNLGYRYGDAQLAAAPELPCFSLGVCYTEKIAQLGRRLDDLLRTRPSPRSAGHARSDAAAGRQTGEAWHRAIHRNGG